MKKENRKEKFVKNPIFPGGKKGMQETVKKNLRYPKTAFANKTEGTVHLRYSIDRSGKTFDIKVVSGIGDGCDEEAKRIVSLFKFRMPRNRAGKLTFHKTLQVHFRLPKGKEKPVVPQTTAVTYSYTTNKQEDKNSGSYSYEISL